MQHGSVAQAGTACGSAIAKTSVCVFRTGSAAEFALVPHLEITEVNFKIIHVERMVFVYFCPVLFRFTRRLRRLRDANEEFL